MSSKRSTSARRRQLRERRRESVDAARSGWTDQTYGIELSETRGGRLQLRWTIEPDAFLALMGLAQTREVIRGLELELVRRLRYDSVMSWADIAPALGVSGEALRKRLSSDVELAQDELDSGAAL